MQYQKPEIKLLEQLADAIQGDTFKGVAPYESNAAMLLSTAASYEADE